MTYTDEQRGEALAAYLEVGTAEASRLLDIPARTIRQWVGDAGLAAAKREQTERASEALAADIEDRRAVIRDLFLEAAEKHARRSLDAKPREAQALAVASAIMIDKFRLESGEVTERTEVLAPSKRVEEKLDELAQRREKREAV